MPTFNYTVLNEQGKQQKGTVVADSVTQARQHLTEKKLYPVDVRESTRRTRADSLPGLAAMSRARAAPRVAALARDLSSLLGAGVTLTDALQALYRQEPGSKLKAMLGSLREEVSAGSSLADAVAKYPGYFERLHIEMIRGGEASGALDKVLDRLAQNLTRRLDIRAKVTAALTYPAAVLAVALGVVTFLMAKVVPDIVSILAERDIELPLSTKVLMGLSGFARNFWWLLIPLAAILLLLVVLSRLWKPSRRISDVFLYSIPILGSLLKKSSLSRFATGLATLLQGGVPLDKALDIASEMEGNVEFRRHTGELGAAIRDGKNLSEVLRRTSFFPPTFSVMVAVGEQSGTLETTLERVSDAYAKDLEHTSNKLLSVLEPAIVIVLAAVVGFIALAVIQPILESSATM